MDAILQSLIIVGIIGAVMGLFIAISSKVFHIETDTRVEDIHEMLPHFNCGACGTPGCMPMAELLVKGEISIQKCRPSKPEQREAINEKLKELGIDVVPA